MICLISYVCCLLVITPMKVLCTEFTHALFLHHKTHSFATLTRSAFSEIWSPSQTIATPQHNTSQHCWPSICKLRPNDRNIWKQQIATLLGATCCTRLATMLQHVETCCELKIELVRMPTPTIVARTWQNDYNMRRMRRMCCLCNYICKRLDIKSSRIRTINRRPRLLHLQCYMVSRGC